MLALSGHRLYAIESQSLKVTECLFAERSLPRQRMLYKRGTLIESVLSAWLLIRRAYDSKVHRQHSSVHYISAFIEITAIYSVNCPLVQRLKFRRSGRPGERTSVKERHNDALGYSLNKANERHLFIRPHMPIGGQGCSFTCLYNTSLLLQQYYTSPDKKYDPQSCSCQDPYYGLSRLFGSQTLRFLVWLQLCIPILSHHTPQPLLRATI